MWGEDARRLTTSAVHTVVARLRRRHGTGLVTTSDAGYLVPADVGTDADHFVALAGAAHDAASRDDAAACEDLCRQAMALWTGDTAYEGLRAELVLAERTRLDELHRRVRADLAECLLRPGASRAALEEALTLARGLLDDNPLDEGAAALAMRAAYRLGRQAEALEVHDVLRRTLRDELGVSPGPAVSAVQARVLAHDATLGGEAAEPSRRTGRSVPVHPARRVPVPASPTVGRAAEVETVLDALAEGRRLVTVTGPGGVGKSRLLADVGAALAPGVDVVHVSLSAHAGLTPAELAAGVAVTTGLPIEGDDEVAGLVRALRSADLTVLVDEAEWVLESAADVTAAVLAGCPGVRLVVTSRTPLSVVGERVVVLEPLATADPEGDLDAVRAAPAVRLLAERLADRGSAPSADLDAWPDADVRVLARVARRVDGLPLALELVAGSSATVPVGHLLDLVESPLDLDTRRPRPARPPPLAARDAVVEPGPPRPRRPHGAAPGRRVRRALHDHGRPGGRRRRPGRGRPRGARARPRQPAAGRAHRHDPVLPDAAYRARPRARGAVRQRRGAAHPVPAPPVVRRHLAGRSAVRRPRRARGSHVRRPPRGTRHGPRGRRRPGRRRPDDDPVGRWQFVETTGPGLHWTAVALALPGVTTRQRARLRVARAGFLRAADWGPAEQARLAADLDGDPDWGTLLALVCGITAYGAG